ncbi:MAG: LamG-like jellyroll fold domain-containing protein [Thermoguttaceae bacterium]
MTDRNAVPHGLFEELHALTAASLSGEITPEQRKRLEALLEDPVAVDLYLDVIHETSTLLAWADYPGPITGGLTMAADGLHWKRPAVGPRRSGFRPRVRRLWLAVVLSLAGVLAIVAIAPHAPLPIPPAPSPAPASVARLVRSYACVWSDADKPLADGDRLDAGKRIELRSGLVEIAFDCGARVILQGPAALVPESARGGSLSSGKITVRADSPAAKGFAIRTPAMTAIDLGTEFGLEVSPAGIEQVHVFRGLVEVAASSEQGPSASPQRLVEKQGMEVDVNTKGVKLVANNGERFARSLDEAQNRRHVVAWWRFEDHPVGVLVPESQEGKAPVRGSLDSSINGNDLYCWSKGTQPAFSSDVPAAEIPLTCEPNATSLDNSELPASHPTRDLFTRSDWSRPSPVDLQTITPAKWTVEASVKPAKLRADYQTFVVRDGIDVCAANPKLAPFTLCITPQKHFEIRFCDVDGRDHTATCAAVTVEENHWYHVAASSDGETLKLYIDSLDGNGYGLRSITSLPKNGSTALACSVWPAGARPDTRHRYIWSVGRGCYDGDVCRWFQGWIDEVRICDVALAPEDFLFAERPEKSSR